MPVPWLPFLVKLNIQTDHVSLTTRGHLHIMYLVQWNKIKGDADLDIAEVKVKQLLILMG